MTLNQTLQNTSQLLRQSHIEDSVFEARILLGHVLNMSQEEIFTQPDYILNPEQKNKLHLLVQRRLKREPASYIVKHKEFFGSRFKVDRRVLIPRPETEILVEEVLAYLKNRIRNNPNEPIIIADVGTGCGAVAVSIALHCPGIKCYAIDISTDALEVARLNAADHHVMDRITFLQGNLLEPLSEAVDIICANPPYVKSSDLQSLSPEIVHFEPDIALDGGHDGLLYIRQLIKHSKNSLRAHGCLMIEIGQGQDIQVTNLVRHFDKTAHFKYSYDLNRIKRVIKICF